MLKVLGGLFVAGGVLIAATAGLCCGAILMSAGSTNKLDDVVMVAIVGGIPFVMGLGMLAGGIAMLRYRKGQ